MFSHTTQSVSRALNSPVRALTAAAKSMGVRGWGVAKGGSSRKGRRGAVL